MIPLSAEERADYVVDSVWELRKRTIGDWTKAITEQIKQAENAAFLKGKETGTQEAYERGKDVGLLDACEKAYDKGFIAGRIQGMKEGDSCTSKSMEIARDAGMEEAARVAEEFEDVNTQDYYGEEIALAIRSLKSEGKPC